MRAVNFPALALALVVLLAMAQGGLGTLSVYQVRHPNAAPSFCSTHADRWPLSD